ncbi:NADH-quinone oxidoreductase subunit NuoN [Magnetospirillum sp. 64-120]|uniref:NADH-quinone oxidoreductase subunit NuoN n=1 Tax=Magnetospirillum sp. 64-120 TaxID=1895778 RepID=UPI000925E174|nr:NADH-quinone oxidoreductase subunit NuoN [Magnetospirillum sp. 64-120]OJX80945.1 MAG: NADH-quinone oxidoreductase subunit N [Magnetospirillum sp. 64-120]
MTETFDLMPVLPELLVVLAAMGLLMLGVFRKGDGTASTTSLAAVTLLVAMLLTWAVGGAERVLAFGGLFVLDPFAVFAKVAILAASTIALVMSLNYLDKEKLGRFEYPILILLATLGMMMMVSANDFLSLYLGLETQSLSLYVLAAFHRDSTKATESGLKYFVLGSLASGMLLYGVSLVYGFSGTTSFDGLAKIFGGEHAAHPHLGFVAGLVFVLAGLAFKISAAPFHMWTPDVYEGAPTPVTSFFAVAPKIAAMALLVRVMTGPFGDMTEQWRQIIVFIALGSMFVGAFAAIAQSNIKRLMAYSSIGHVGFMLAGVAAGTAAGVQAVLVYLGIYLTMNVGVFAVILSMRQKGRLVEGIDDLAGLGKTNPAMAAAMAVLMFSMAGIPPMAGFIGKFYVFKAAVDAGLYTLAIIGVLTSVVSAYYYLRIIKVMYFDEAVESFDRASSKALGLVMAAATVVNIVFVAVPGPLLTSAKAAAAVLFPAAG